MMRRRTVRLDCGHWITPRPFRPWLGRRGKTWPPPAWMWRGHARCPVHGMRAAEEVWSADLLGRPVKLR